MLHAMLTMTGASGIVSRAVPNTKLIVPADPPGRLTHLSKFGVGSSVDVNAESVHANVTVLNAVTVVMNNVVRGVIKVFSVSVHHTPNAPIANNVGSNLVTTVFIPQPCPRGPHNFDTAFIIAVDGEGERHRVLRTRRDTKRTPGRRSTPGARPQTIPLPYWKDQAGSKRYRPGGDLPRW